ncbi:unnamed protein product [Ectocarpus sp. 8 AP-2014]
MEIDFGCDDVVVPQGYLGVCLCLCCFSHTTSDGEDSIRVSAAVPTLDGGFRCKIDGGFDGRNFEIFDKKKRQGDGLEYLWAARCSRCVLYVLACLRQSHVGGGHHGGHQRVGWVLRLCR